MLETNKPYMFSSSTTTTTTSTTTATGTPPPPPAATTTTTITTNTQVSNRPPPPPMDHHGPGLSQQGGGRPMNYYSTPYARQQEDMMEEEYYHGQPARLNSAFGRHQETNSYTYKPTTTTTTASNNNTLSHSNNNLHHTNSTRPLPYAPLPPHIKREEPAMLIPPPMEETENGWFDNHYMGHHEAVYAADSSDNKRMKRRKEMTSKMEKLNLDFLEKKDGLYAEKLILVNTELKEAHGDTHAFYLDGLRHLKELRQKMIEDGQLFREYQNRVTDKQFELEIYQAEEEYTAETQEIREKLFTVLEEKRRKLKEDKDNCELAYDVVLESQSRLHKRNLRKRGPENSDNKANKRKQLNGPTLVFRLKDEDIHSDMQAMRIGLSTPNKKK